MVSLRTENFYDYIPDWITYFKKLSGSSFCLSQKTGEKNSSKTSTNFSAFELNPHEIRGNNFDDFDNFDSNFMQTESK